MEVVLRNAALAGMCVTECVSIAGERVNEAVKTSKISPDLSFVSPELECERLILHFCPPDLTSLFNY